MAFLGQSFNVNELPEQQNDYAPLPDGWYSAVINKVELRNTKDGTGQCLAVRYDIIAPTHQGRVVFGNLNIKNKSSQAEEIGRQQLGSLMRAIGLATLEDSDQLVGGNVQIKLATRQQVGYEPTNEIRAFKPIGGETPQPTPKAATTQAATNASAPPWSKK